MSEHIQRHPEMPLNLGKCLIVIAGPPLSGKTTLATILSESLGIDILDIDQGWREKWGGLENRPPMTEVYDYNQERAKPYMAEDLPVILVATYSWAGYHDKLKEFAKQMGTPVRVFLLKPPLEIIIQRVSARQSDPNNISDIATPERAEELYNRYQSIESDQEATLLVVEMDATQPPQENVERILASLSDLRKD